MWITRRAMDSKLVGCRRGKGQGVGRRLAWWGLPLAIAVSVVSGCGGSSHQVAAGGPAATSATEAEAPSASAKMVCTPEAQVEIATVLGAHTTRAVKPTWNDHLYSCRYAYSTGQIVLSVKELGDPQATSGYFDGLAQRLGKRSDVGGLGQAAFDTSNDSIVVRKDYKVLDVDVSGLPARFGNPTVDRSTTAMKIALAVMGCWTGH
jgi:hypothetical protein